MTKATSSRNDRMVSSVPLILQATLTERIPQRLIPTGWYNHVSSAFLLWFSVYWPLRCSSLWFPEDFEAPSVGDWRRWTETSPWGSLLFRVILFLQVCLKYASWGPIQHSLGSALQRYFHPSRQHASYISRTKCGTFQRMCHLKFGSLCFLFPSRQRK